MSHANAHAFRPDIEGLRAVAILLVVAAHAGVPAMAGGFVGVDVFFVISGYLITRLLQAEWEGQGRIDIAGFYARRLRRLLPAFMVVVAAVVAAIWIVYAPIEQGPLLSSALAASLYFSNVHYALEATNYLGPAAKLDPLLHTWSLGVEEQFYLAWPLLLVGAGLLARRLGRPTLGAVLGLLMLLSLGASLWLTEIRQPLAFFLPFTRAWEFGAGAMVALYGPRWLRAGGGLATLMARPVAGNSLLIAAFALIAGAALLLDEQATFPGLAVLAPVAGTALLILLLPAAAPDSLVSRALSLAPMQWIGRLSYGWYLWHWPLLVIGKVVLPAQGLAVNLCLAGAALLLAQASFALVEQPVRTRPFFRRTRPVYLMSVLVVGSSVGAMLAVGNAGQALAHGARFQALMAARTDMPALYAYDCDRWFYDDSLMECVGGAPAGARTVVLLGDSHAGQWFTAVNAIAARKGWRLVVMTKSACPLVAQDYFYARIGRVFSECGRWKRKAAARLRQLRPDLIIASQYEKYPFTAEEWRTGMLAYLPEVAASTPLLVLLRDTPNPGFSTPECLARRDWNPHFSLRPCSFDPATAMSRTPEPGYAALAARQANVRVLDLTPLICPGGPCQVREGGVIKYRDANHLTDSFVKVLAPGLAAALEQAGAFAP